MNRVLAVRGQVVPVARDAARRSTPRSATGRVVDGQSRDRADDRHRAGLAHARTTSRACEDALRGDRRGRAHRPRPGQPLHEHPAEPAPARDPRRRRWRSSAPPDLRLQRRDAGRRDRGLRPRRPRRGPRAPHAAPGIVDVVLANNRFAARRPAGSRGEPVRLRWPPAGRRAAAPRPRRRRRSGQRPSTTTRSGWPRRSCGSLEREGAPGAAHRWPGRA